MELFTVRKGAGYYAQGSAHWFNRRKIIAADFGHAIGFSQFHGLITARNVVQVILGVGSDRHVQTIEAIGVRFNEAPSLRAPDAVRGNVLITGITGGSSTSALSDGALPFTIDAGREDVQLAYNMEKCVFRLGFTAEPSTEYISPSANVIFGLTNGALCEIYIINPARARLE